MVKEIIRQGILMPVEYASKVSSLPAGILALGSKGNFLEKMMSGASKVVTVPMEAVSRASFLLDMKADELNPDVTKIDFLKKYGGGTVDYVGQMGQDVVAYFNQALTNYQDQPIETIAAGVGITGLLYGVGRLAKFWRQKGQGSWLDKKERGWGNKIWD